MITGELGSVPGCRWSDSRLGWSTGPIHADDPAATQAQGDVATAYAFTTAQSCDQDFSGQDLGDLTLPPGVRCLASTAQPTGTPRLDAQGNPCGLALPGDQLAHHREQLRGRADQRRGHLGRQQREHLRRLRRRRARPPPAPSHRAATSPTPSG
ncbi:ice-binding family protein [Actinosynnema sp. NPDC023587]|uniref:ice-binding family protein n=1 Tax=Actinosynnema sp. NPDC023587 TaxID=3154695 RepID=UPI0033D17181